MTGGSGQSLLSCKDRPWCKSLFRLRCSLPVGYFATAHLTVFLSRAVERSSCSGNSQPTGIWWISVRDMPLWQPLTKYCVLSCRCCCDVSSRIITHVGAVVMYHHTAFHCSIVPLFCLCALHAVCWLCAIALTGVCKMNFDFEL